MLLTLTGYLRQSKKENDFMKTVRVGIVGIGNIGTAHTNLIYSGGVDGFLLTAVCDISQERKEYCKLNYPNVSFF